jgi:hypothetical protein
MTDLSPQMNSLLLRLERDGKIDVVNGDPWPVDENLVAEARKLGLLHFSDGDGRNTVASFWISRRGRRAIGIAVPPTWFERVVSWFSAPAPAADELNWHKCQAPLIPRRTIDGSRTSTEGHTLRRRNADGRCEYKQDAEARDDWMDHQW